MLGLTHGSALGDRVPGFGDRLPWGRRGGGFNLRRRHLLLFFRGPLRDRRSIA